MKNRKIRFIVIAIVFISLFIAMIKIQVSFDNKLREEFPRITTDDSLNFKVLNFKAVKGVSLITTDKKKFRISSSQNYDYKSEYIDNNIFIGDSLVKNSGSDTIYIYSENGIKYFVHQKVINRPD